MEELLILEGLAILEHITFGEVGEQHDFVVAQLGQLLHHLREVPVLDAQLATVAYHHQ